MTAPAWKTAFENLAAVKVDDSDWQRSHAGKRKPRGSWAFSMINPRGKEDIFETGKDYVFWPRGSLTYADAVKAAKAEAKKRGVNTVYVLA